MESKRGRSRPFRLDEMPINDDCRSSFAEIRQFRYIDELKVISQIAWSSEIQRKLNVLIKHIQSRS